MMALGRLRFASVEKAGVLFNCEFARRLRCALYFVREYSLYGAKTYANVSQTSPSGREKRGRVRIFRFLRAFVVVRFDLG